jgi:hypothetical protein
MIVIFYFNYKIALTEQFILLEKYAFEIKIIFLFLVATLILLAFVKIKVIFTDITEAIAVVKNINKRNN